MEDDAVDATLAALRAELSAAEAAVAVFGPSPEQLRAEAAEAERLAKENGTPAKSARVIGVLARRWKEFLEVHGDAYEYDASIGPTIDLAVHFQVRLRAPVCVGVWLRSRPRRLQRVARAMLRASAARAKVLALGESCRRARVPCRMASQAHGFRERKNQYSTTGEEGMGDSWGALAVPYLLAKYVFPMLEHVGWVGLREAQLLEKARPFSLELRANWARLKVANVRAGTGNGRSLKKDRWCDVLLFRAQVSILCMRRRGWEGRGMGGSGGLGG